MSDSKELRKLIKKYGKVYKWLKIQAIYKKNDVKLEFLIDKNKRRNIIHIMCKELAHKELNLFLQDSYDVSCVDKYKNTALHLYLMASLKKRNYKHVTSIWELFVSRFSEIKNMKNDYDETPFDVLAKISDRLNTVSNKPPVDDSWEEELMEDAYCEYMDNWGKYEQDFYVEVNESESYTDWSARMQREHTDRARGPMRQSPERPPPSSEPKEAAEDLVAEAQRQQLREERLCGLLYERYRVDWADFSARVKSPPTVEWRVASSSLPMLPGSGDDSRNLVELVRCHLCRYPPSQPATSEIGQQDLVRKELKQLQIVWHPDRFMHRCADLVSDQDRDAVQAIVVAASQRVNQAILSLG